MKVLFFCSADFDYLQDLTYSGLIRTLGHSNVQAVPWNSKQHIPYWQYPKNIAFSGLRAPSLSSIDWRSFDVTILGSSKPDVVRLYNGSLSKLAAKTITVFLDGGDSAAVGGDLDSVHAELLYAADKERPFDLILKREYLIGTVYEDRVIPFPLSFPSHFLNRVVRREELFDVTFWAVESSPIRTKAFEILKGKFDCDLNGTSPGQTLRGYSRKGVSYLHDLASSKVTINLRGVGWDTLRFWEAVSLGVCTVSQRLQIVIPEPFVEGRHIVYVDDSLDSLLEVCSQLLGDSKRRRTIGYAARAHAHKYHSNLARSAFLLKLIEGRRRQTFIYSTPPSASAAVHGLPARTGSEVIRIGVILFGLMGDVLMRTRALFEVRQRYTSAVIDCYVDKIGLEVLRLTGIDCNIILVDRALYSRPLSKLQKFFSRVRLALNIYRLRYDLFIDLYVSPSSHLLSQISFAPVIIIAGFERQILRMNKIEITRSVESLSSVNNFHMSLPSLSAVSMLTGSNNVGCVRPFLSPCLKGIIEPPRSPYFLLSIGAGDPNKVPPLNFFSSFVNFVLAKTSLRVKIICNPGFERVSSDLQKSLASVADRTDYLPTMNLGQLKYFFCNAAFFVGPDSGLLHLAYGFRTPTTGIFTFTNPNLVDPRSDLDCCLFVEDTERFQEDPTLPKGRKFTLCEVAAEVESFLNRVACSSQTKSRPWLLS